MFTLGLEQVAVAPSEKRDLFPGALELMVLRSLALEPLHGYALATRIQQRSRDLLQVEEGSLYPALQRLLKAGLVDAVWTTSQTNRRVRTYSLTAKGRKHLAREAAAFGQMVEGIQLVLDSE
jgi:PadR family transcriptional regulator, regulatory protein PadR